MYQLTRYLPGVALLVFLFSSCLYIVHQKQYAILFAFGELKEVVKTPGLHWKLPPPFQNVVFLDNRILTIDASDTDRFITAEKKNILIDSYVKWRVVDPKAYYISFRGDEKYAQDRLSQITKAALNEEVTKRTVKQVISDQRIAVMQALHRKVAAEAQQVGIDIVDIRLKRVDYVEQINHSVYERMKSERMRVANQLRSTGFAESEKIRANADKQRAVILAEAYRDAEKVRGEGDAQAIQIYADAFGQNQEFYKFYRSLEAYRKSFKTNGDFLVLDPRSEFFKYFNDPSGQAK